MRSFPSSVAAGLAVLALSACARNLPNTDIRDTEDNRAIIGVVDAYRKAFDARDVQGVMALVSPGYYDDAGTVDPSDDVDYKSLPGVLQETFSRLSQVRLEMGITAITLISLDTANVDMFYDAKYRVATPRADIPKRDTDVQRIVMKKEGGAWRIVTGL
jgi:ketosteroid isomerase-like protein